ncbi:hypothetical protein [Pantoea sp. 1.19]|uniref:hypothetical protein n=1 Tax=Pantoea sp. 1.19 TaxID=1925589 RepID=UPI0011152A9F|nr:hypothetical protein [Pantoea sp. 1.19]
MDFLAATCNKRWSFVDAIYGVMPIFGMVTKGSSRRRCGPEQLKEQAMQILSPQVSDAINLARLIALAAAQHITRFDILLPYPLSDEQLHALRQEYARPVTLTLHEERLQVELPAH